MFKSPWEKSARNTAGDWLKEMKSASDRLALMRTVEAGQTFCWVCNTKLMDGQGRRLPHADGCEWKKEAY